MSELETINENIATLRQQLKHLYEKRRTLKHPPRPTYLERAAQIMSMIESGMSIDQIAQISNRKWATIRSTVHGEIWKRAGYPLDGHLMYEEMSKVNRALGYPLRLQKPRRKG